MVQEFKNVLIDYLRTLPKYPRITLIEERRLIAKAKKGSKKEIEELVLRHTKFVIFRIYKKTFPFDSLKAELKRESQQSSPDWERYDPQEEVVCL